MGVAATLAPKGLGLQDPTKKLSHRVELLGQPLSQKNVFENLGPEPPLIVQKIYKSSKKIYESSEKSMNLSKNL